MKVKHLGGGVVLIEDLLDAETLKSIDFGLIESSCTPIGYKKIDGKDYMEGGYYIPEKDLITMPIRYMQGIDKFDFYQAIDNAAYIAAVEYCKIFPIATENITSFNSKHFVKYLPGGVMGTHSDASISYKEGTLEPASISSIGNTVSMSIILNDEFIGGKMNFKLWDIGISPKPGSALLYPSNYIGAHEVEFVTAGVRWVFLAFLSHGDKSFTVNPELERYSERYEWTMKFRQYIRDYYNQIGSDSLDHIGNLNFCQKKVI
jgi:hypothetical protein